MADYYSVKLNSCILATLTVAVLAVGLCDA